jgi:hypothetical protein
MNATMTMVAQAATALGGIIWGLAAHHAGVVPTFLGAARPRLENAVRRLFYIVSSSPAIESFRPFSTWLMKRLRQASAYDRAALLLGVRREGFALGRVGSRFEGKQDTRKRQRPAKSSMARGVGH